MIGFSTGQAMIQLQVEDPFHIDKPFKHVKKDPDITKDSFKMGGPLTIEIPDLIQKIRSLPYIVKYPRYCANKFHSRIFHSKPLKKQT
jgi:hypothetical protein